MDDVRWLKNTEELLDYARAEGKGRTGEEFEVKELVVPGKETKKKAKKEKENE